MAPCLIMARCCVYRKGMDVLALSGPGQDVHPMFVFGSGK